MARKSKASILRSRLGAVSKCPCDLFDRISDTELILSLVEDAERGDSHALLAAVRLLAEQYIENGDSSEALIYLLSIGIERQIRECAELAVRYSHATFGSFELARSAISLIEADGADGELAGLISDVWAMIAVKTVGTGGKQESELCPEAYPLEYIYVSSAIGRDCTDVCRATGLLRLPSLPSSQMGKAAFECENDEAELKIMEGALSKYPDPLWRDFWLRCIYELALGYIEDGLEVIAGTVIAAAQWRSYSSEKSLHALAWCEYLYALHPSCEELCLRCESLRQTCLFEGLDPRLDDALRERYMREAIYLPSAERIEESNEENILGTVIEHKRNRYSLTLDLKNRGKRARMHYWETTLSVRCPPRTELVFNEISGFDVNCSPTRGGVTLERDRSTCQLIARSELTVDEVRHPFELDIYADIAYISATKCRSIFIKPTSSERHGEYLVMRCDVFLK